MQSPFDLFRKNQKLLMAATIGLAMFGFVVAPAITDPTNMPPILVAIFLACALGGVGWLLGIRSKKTKEWGLGGIIAGLVLGIVLTMAVGPQDVVKASTGDIDQQEMNFLMRQRAAGNQFISMAFRRAQDNGAQVFQAPTTFGFGHPDETKDVVVGELLRREADRLGLEVTDETVNDFIRSMSQGKVGASDVREIRDMLGLSETGLYEVLKSELKALTMARFLYGGTSLPPETYWDFYRQMNIQQSVGIVPVPVESFVNKSAEPSEAELQELFKAHQANYPNTTVEGRLDEGNPGFRQPRKVKLEYVEIPYEAVEKTVGEVTDEEIEAFYEEFYKTAPAEESSTDGADSSSTDGPALESPEASEPASGDPEAMKEENENEPADGASQDSPDETKPVEQPKSSAEATEPAEESETQDSDSPKADETPSEPEGGASLDQPSTLELVAFFDDAQSTDDPEQTETNDTAGDESTEAPKEGDDASNAESPKPEKKPADEPTDEPAQSENADSDGPPPPALPEAMKKDDAPSPEGDVETAPTTTPEDEPVDPLKPRELDDELREEIRDQILRRRTVDRMQKLVTEVYNHMLEDLALLALAAEDDPEGMSPEAISEKLKAFAEERNLVHDVTPLMTYRELSQSEEHPIGRAASDTNFQSSGNVADTVFNSTPTITYSAQSVLDIESGSRFVYWKIEDAEAYQPESLESPGIREQVVNAWRELQARENAKQRAEELAKQAEGIDKPLSEILAETTVTGEADGQAVSVIHPPRFSWLTRANPQMSPNPFNRPAPQRTQLRTVPGLVGVQFMETVFNELREGEVGVTHSVDKSHYYVVRIDERTYGTSEDMQAFRDRFTREPLFAPFGFSDYAKLADAEQRQYRTNWADELFEKHGVDFSGLERQRAEEQQTDG